MNHRVDMTYLGQFLGLGAAAAELRGRQPDSHFVDRLIEIEQEYRKHEAASLREQLHRGDTITNLLEIVNKRISQ